MSRPTLKIGRQAINMMLSALEAPRATLTTAAIRTLPADAAAQLLSSGLLKRDGYEPVINDHDDAGKLVRLTWSEEHQKYGFFDPVSGWRSVPHQDIVRYSVNIPGLILALTAEMKFPPKSEATPLIGDCLWEVGQTRFGGRRTSTPVLFARRLNDRARWPSLRRVIEARASEAPSVILTSTRFDLVPDMPSGSVPITITDVLRDSLGLNPSVIAARLDGLSTIDLDEPLTVLAGGKNVRFLGQTFRFPKGVHQRRIIDYMHRQYRAGRRLVPSEEIAEELGLKSRLRDYFKKSPAWNHLLTERGGMCSFCWPEQKS
jgi:hypothetical protein